MASRLIPRLRNLTTDLRRWAIRTRRIVETGIPDGKHCSTVDYALVGGRSIDAMRPDGLGRVSWTSVADWDESFARRAATARCGKSSGIEGDAAIATECGSKRDPTASARIGPWQGKSPSFARLVDADELDSVWKNRPRPTTCSARSAKRRCCASPAKIGSLKNQPVRFAYVNPAYESALAGRRIRRNGLHGAGPEGGIPTLEVAFWESCLARFVHQGFARERRRTQEDSCGSPPFSGAVVRATTDRPGRGFRAEGKAGREAPTFAGLRKRPNAAIGTEDRRGAKLGERSGLGSTAPRPPRAMTADAPLVPDVCDERGASTTDFRPRTRPRAERGPFSPGGPGA